MHVGQPPFDAVVVEAQAFMVEAQQVQDRCVQIVNRRAVFLGTVTELVGGSIREAVLDLRVGEPNGKAVRIVVTAMGAAGRPRRM
jgi:hypothetical protein